MINKKGLYYFNLTQLNPEHNIHNRKKNRLNISSHTAYQTTYTANSIGNVNVNINIDNIHSSNCNGNSDCNMDGNIDGNVTHDEHYYKKYNQKIGYNTYYTHHNPSISNTNLKQPNTPQIKQQPITGIIGNSYCTASTPTALNTQNPITSISPFTKQSFIRNNTNSTQLPTTFQGYQAVHQAAHQTHKKKFSNRLTFEKLQQILNQTHSSLAAPHRSKQRDLHTMNKSKIIQAKKTNTCDIVGASPTALALEHHHRKNSLYQNCSDLSIITAKTPKNKQLKECLFKNMRTPQTSQKQRRSHTAMSKILKKSQTNPTVATSIPNVSNNINKSQQLSSPPQLPPQSPQPQVLTTEHTHPYNPNSLTHTHDNNNTVIYPSLAGVFIPSSKFKFSNQHHNVNSYRTSHNNSKINNDKEKEKAKSKSKEWNGDNSRNRRYKTYSNL